MDKYKIVKESKALPVDCCVGSLIEDNKVMSQNGKNYVITDPHLNALIELGVVEEVKEWNLRKPTFYTTVVRSPQWEAWYEHHVRAMEWDVAESQETGWLSPEHFHAFMEWVKIEARKKWLEEIETKLKSWLMNYDSKDGYSTLHDLIVEHLYDRLEAELKTLK